MFLTVIILFIGYNTFSRNKAWASELTLLEDAHHKAPLNGRVTENLAIELVHQNQLEKALLLFKKAYTLPQATKKIAEAYSLNGQGAILYKQGKISESVNFYKKALEISPEHDEARGNLIISFMKLGRLLDALALFQTIPKKSHFRDFPLQGIILLRLNKPEEALKVLSSAPRNEILAPEIMQVTGKALSMLGHYEQADFFLRQHAQSSLPDALCQIENLINAGESEKSKAAAKNLFANFPAQDVMDRLTTDDPLMYPLDRQSLYPLMLKQAREFIQEKNLP